jgi:hypothetical protein
MPRSVLQGFYAQTLGFDIVREQDEVVWFRCGAESRPFISASTTGTADEQTQSSWRVDDIASEVAELRSRGVEFIEYDMPGLTTRDGMAEVSHVWVAWFTDRQEQPVSHPLQVTV